MATIGGACRCLILPVTQFSGIWQIFLSGWHRKLPPVQNGTFGAGLLMIKCRAGLLIIKRDDYEEMTYILDDPKQHTQVQGIEP